ncbi:MAG TPA: hypothetical protein VFO36_11155 [Nitrospiraceae bacterium]|nr:hypothetical protein [Nitrospiraceae bacterium]
MKTKLAIAFVASANVLSFSPAFAAGVDQERTHAASAEDASIGTDVASAASLATIQAGSPDSEGDWNVSFTPYLWVAGVSGDLKIPRAGTSVEIDRSFSDILGNLKFAFMGSLDVEYKRVVVIADAIYLNASAKAENIENPLVTEGKVDAKTFVASGAIGYRVVDKGPLFVDILAGARLVSLDVDVELISPLGTFRAGASPSKVAPMVGGRVRVPLAPRWAVAVYGDVGINSDLKWQVLGTVQYDLGRHWRLAAGYRHMAIHHDRERGDIDLGLSGPIVGITYRF